MNPNKTGQGKPSQKKDVKKPPAKHVQHEKLRRKPRKW